jgi:shikimate dehydrogenase
VPLAKAKSEIIVANRTRENGLALVEKLNRISKANFVDFKELDSVIFDVNIVINCTSCGMRGCQLESPIEVSLLRKDMIVFDMVYSPMHTKLITEAERIGAKVIYGYEMFIHQGAKAFELWTRKNAPYELMKKAVLDALDV